MLKTSFIFFVSLSALAQNPGGLMPPFGAPGPLGSQPSFFKIDRIDSLMLRFNAVAQPSLENPGELKLSLLVTKTGNVWHRFVIDKVHRQYFGYDVTVETTQGRYRVAFGPPSTLPQGPGFVDPTAGLSLVPPPKYPEPMTVWSGDTIALDLLVSPDGKQKIIDTIQFSSTPPADPPAAIGTAEPKDVTFDDGPVKIDFTGFVLINGQRFMGQTWFEKKPGATLWFSFPGEGRYVLSLAPHEGFQKTGAIRGNVISFESDGQRYEIRMRSPVVGSQGPWNVYVLHDPFYLPEHSTQQIIPSNTPSGMAIVVCGTDRLENLLPRK